MKGDFTRSTFHPEKHYRSVLMQQGRVQLDADWNEQLDITLHRIETETVDVVGQSGVPMHDAGFALTPGPGGDFTIGAGRMYVDGILCENDEAVPFTKQPDLPTATPIGAAGRYFVYLDVWQRHITALDDAGIREVALGGPDTATRAKTVWQVKAVGVGSGDTCPSLPQSWLDATAQSSGKLSARARPGQKSSTPCIIPPGAGYRRLENQLYRVEIHRGGLLGSPGVVPTFKWSRDNGSVASAIQSIASDTVTLVSAHHDPVTGFAPDQWIEITDDRNDLLGVPGRLARITNVEDLVLTIDLATAIPTTLVPPDPDPSLHPKVRRWDSVAALDVAIPSGNGGFLALEDGVEVRFENGSYRSGDYWTIPARTDTGAVEWPLDSGAPKALPAFGIVHHFAKLAVIDCTINPAAIALVEDCRKPFPPLTEVGSGSCCCSFSVSADGKGDFTSIGDALAALPASGGEICVLPGDYVENVLIFRKRNVTIHGCGLRSRVTSNPPGANSVDALPVFTISRSLNITIEALNIVADDAGVGILVDLVLPQTGFEDVKSNTIEHSPFLAGSRVIQLRELEVAAAKRSAMEVHDADFVLIERCVIEMRDAAGRRPAVFFGADDGLILNNLVAGSGLSAPGTKDSTKDNTGFTGLGSGLSAAAAVAPVPGGVSGIQLAGGSERVRVRENLIRDLSGQGITLGSIDEVDGKGGRIRIIGWPANPNDPCDPCRPPVFVDPVITLVDGGTVTRSSSGDLYDIEILSNHIGGTGLDGIGVAGYFDLRGADELISVHRLTIEDNDIRDCLLRPLAPIPFGMVNSMGYGGIALSDVEELDIRGNVIENCARKQPTPACGIFILHGEGVAISGNRILNNGRSLTEKEEAMRLGRRGGINIVYAVAPMVAAVTDPASLSKSWTFPVPAPSGLPAAAIHGNIVDAPVAQALSVVALGSVSVLDNRFSSRDVIRGTPFSLLFPSTVLIGNLGVSNELYLQLLLFRNALKKPSVSPGLDDVGLGKYLADGNVLFANNQCSFDVLGGGVDMAFSSISIFSLDDIAFENNQSDCNLLSGQDFVLVNAFLLGISLRMIGNRFKEGLLNAPLSAWTLGTMNTTVNNQATHCIFADGAPALLLNDPNTILINALANGFCDKSLGATLVKFLKLIGG